MKTGPKPKCSCGICPTCYFRKVKRDSRAKALKRSPIKRGSPPKRTAMQTRKAAIKKKRSKPRRTSAKKNPAYVNWLHERKCIACAVLPRDKYAPFMIIDAAHTENNGMRSKGPDSSRVPLCRNPHHREYDAGREAFELKYGLDMKAQASAHYAAFLIVREDQ